jgi:hypothetical protein
MVLILRTKKVKKYLLETSRFNLTTENGVTLKMHFGELKMRCYPNTPIHIVCYIRNDFECLELINVFSFEIWTTFVFPLFSSKAITTHISFNLLDCSLLHIGILSDILPWSLIWGPKEKIKAYWKFPGLICQQILVLYKKCILASWLCVFFQPLQST